MQSSSSPPTNQKLLSTPLCLACDMLIGWIITAPCGSASAIHLLASLLALKTQLHQFEFSLKNTYFIQTVLGNKNQFHIQLNPVTAQCYQPFSTQILFIFSHTENEEVREQRH